MATQTKQEFEYKAEMKQLLHLIVHSLYTHPEVFLRELISNASDALNKVRFLQLTRTDLLDSGEELKIQIHADEKKKTFSIQDNGIGMTKEELIQNIGTIARSGTLELLRKLREENKTIDDTLIGQFGVGFYSVFMVTDQVIIETRHARPDATGCRWISDGQGKFTIEEIDLKNRGTKISFILKEEAGEFAEEYRIKEIIRKYSNFVNFPVYLGKEKANQVQALWHKKSASIEENEANEFYKYITNDFENPQGFFHISLEGTVNFKALLFIPPRAPAHLQQYRDEKSLRLYCNKILIQEDCRELLPEYLRFIKGVVDTEDLPLNVSREVTQASPVMAKIKKVLVGKVFSFLEDWAANQPEKYTAFYKNFNPILKTGIESDFENKEKITDLLRFETTKTKPGQEVSLKEYTGRMGKDQKEIYYLAGDGREALEYSPNLEYFRKNDVEVLFLTDPVDVFVVPLIREYDKKPLKSIDQADLDLIQGKNKIETPESGLDASLLAAFKKALGEQVSDVVASKRLVDSPVTLVAGKGSMDSQMEKMMKMMNKNFVGTKKVLEVNLSHPLIRNLSRLHLANSADPVIQDAMLQLYEGALFQEGTLTSPATFIQRMHGLLEKATR